MITALVWLCAYIVLSVFDALWRIIGDKDPSWAQLGHMSGLLVAVNAAAIIVTILVNR